MTGARRIAALIGLILLAMVGLSSCSASTFTDEIAKLDPSATYAIYCQSGRRAGVAADAMAGAGFTDLYRLEGGGFAELRAAGAPVATG